MGVKEFHSTMRAIEKKIISLNGKPIVVKDLIIKLYAAGYCTNFEPKSLDVEIRTKIMPAIEKKWYEEKGEYFLCTGKTGFFIAKNADDAVHSLDSQLGRIREQFKRWEAKTAHFNKLFPDGRSQQELDFEIPGGNNGK